MKEERGERLQIATTTTFQINWKPGDWATRIWLSCTTFERTNGYRHLSMMSSTMKKKKFSMMMMMMHWLGCWVSSKNGSNLGGRYWPIGSERMPSERWPDCRWRRNKKQPPDRQPKSLDRSTVRELPDGRLQRHRLLVEVLVVRRRLLSRSNRQFELWTRMWRVIGSPIDRL